MAPDWPKDRWFQEGGVRGKLTGPCFLGLENGWGGSLDGCIWDRRAGKPSSRLHLVKAWGILATEC